MGVILLSGVIIMYCVCIDNTRLMVVSCGGDWLVLYCVPWSSLDSRPIKIRPGTYCRGDSLHALVYSPESGESPFSFSHLFSIFVHQLSSLLRCSRRLSH